MNSYVWKYQLDELSRNFQVIAVDLRGHGKSEFHGSWVMETTPSVPLNKGGFKGGCPLAPCPLPLFDTFAQDLKELTDFLNIKEFILVGWSMASFIIVRYYFNYPEDVDKLIFISGTPKFLSEAGYTHGQSKIMVKRLEQNLKRDYKNHIKEFCNKFFLSGEKIDGKRLTEIKRLMFNEDFPPQIDVTLQTLNALLKDDIRDNLKHIRVPALIIHGSIDKICPVGAGKYMARYIQNSRIVILKGIGHAPFLTQPERVNKEIKDFCHNSATN
ncbi:MAG: alpha/beta hydrolase [Nitrospinota bacterium]